ncbi:hypothetical protein HC928_22250, partial [bacterium]|nr:hypothetical protein [bacterium]
MPNFFGQTAQQGVGVSFSIDVLAVNGQASDPATLANLAAARADLTVDFWTGNPDGTGGVDLSDPCLSFNGGVTVTWHEPPTVALPDVEIPCEAFSSELFISVDPPSGNYLFFTDN